MEVTVVWRGTLYATISFPFGEVDIDTYQWCPHHMGEAVERAYNQHCQQKVEVSEEDMLLLFDRRNVDGLYFKPVDLTASHQAFTEWLKQRRFDYPDPYIETDGRWYYAGIW